MKTYSLFSDTATFIMPQPPQPSLVIRTLTVAFVWRPLLLFGYSIGLRFAR